MRHREQSFYYYQLGKRYALTATLYMQKFRNKGLCKDHEKQSTTNDVCLYKSAKDFTRSLIYGQLYSPRSRALVNSYNRIHDNLRILSPDDLRKFRACQREAQEHYKDTILEPFDFSNLESWIDDNFGPEKAECEEERNNG